MTFHDEYHAIDYSDYSQDILNAVPHVTCPHIYIYMFHCMHIHIVCIYIYITFRHEKYPANLLLTSIKHRVHYRVIP